MKGSIVTLLTLLAFLGSPYSHAQSLALEPCQVTTINGLYSSKAHCASLNVAENPDHSNGRRIDLRIVIFKARTKTPLPDPIFYFAGGPGGSAVESFPNGLNALRYIRQQRDIVFIDQRGTGQSHPLNCEGPEDLSYLKQPLTADQRKAYIQQCLNSLDADTRYYTTLHAAADFNAVRLALGYQTINLYGVSYGTRMAQQFMRHYPDAVRSVILDGVVPSQLILGSEHAIKLEQTLNNVIHRCQQQVACNTAFPKLNLLFTQLKQTVNAKPLLITATLPKTGEVIEMLFNRDQLTLSLRLLAYSQETQALLPLLIYEAATSNNYQRIASLALLISENVSQSISGGLEASVMCAEEVPFYQADHKAAETLMGNSLISNSKQQCALWPHIPVDDNFHDAVKSDLPVLLISGLHDPVTPPEYGEISLKQYQNGIHLIAPGQGHGVASRGCMPKIMQRFVNSGSVQALQPDCLQELGTAAFFTDLLGGQP